MRRIRFIRLYVFLISSIPLSANAGERGAGTNFVSSYIYRDSLRSGAAVQPSLWVYTSRARTLLTVWSSVRVANPRLDDVVLDVRSGVPFKGRGWVGGTLHWDWTAPTVRAQSFHALELGALLTWFSPPYRPTLALSYDVLHSQGLLAAFSVPYTVRLAWLPSTTFIPEIGLRSGGPYGTLDMQYLSFTALIERRVRWLVMIPMVGVVPKGALREWLVWGGIHLNASQ